MFLRSLRSIYFEVYKHPRVFVTSCRELYEYILLQHVRLHVGTYGCWAAPRAGNSSKYFIVLFLNHQFGFPAQPLGRVSPLRHSGYTMGTGVLLSPPPASSCLYFTAHRAQRTHCSNICIGLCELVSLALSAMEHYSQEHPVRTTEQAT